MKVNIYTFIGVAWFVIFPATVVISEVTEHASLTSPNPLRSGARALGMGNAFIAVADDATAGSFAGFSCNFAA